ncbi:MAG TPA: alpha/beta hydrolase [Caldisericia bacterium]|jgi:proline-specific peptidase|nr:alpha/beta hydrolase [Caldisericia bacterium]
MNYFNEWLLQVPDGTIFVREIGTGETFVVLHGGWGAEHSYLLDPLIPFKNQIHLIFYDQRGSLRSSCKKESISLERHVEDLEKLRLSLHLEKMSLICHSMGSFLALQYLKQYPNNVKNMILISPVYAKASISSLTEDIESNTLARWERENVVDLLKKYHLQNKKNSEFSDKERALWHRITFSAINLHDVSHWEQLRSCFYFKNEAGQSAANSMPESWDFSPQIQGIEQKLSVILGDDDYIPIQPNLDFYRLYPGVDMHILHHAGHVCWIDQSVQFSDVMNQILRTTKPFNLPNTV